MEKELTGKGVNLPPEIMHDILSRLPAKPLSRFKLVSKSWLSLISNTNFITMHSKAIETNQNLLFQRRRVLFTDQRLLHHYSLDLDQFLDVAATNENAYVEGLTQLHLQRYRSFRHDAPNKCDLSCNGFVLIMIESTTSFKELYLFNPLGMEEPKQLPSPPGESNSFGLGFDYSTNEHKVVNLEMVSDHEFAFNLYTLETDLWRRAGLISLFPKKAMVFGREGVLVNGGVHWLIREDRKNTGVSFLIGNEENDKENSDRRVLSEDGFLIIGFMIKEEKITTIRLPKLLLGLNDPNIELGVFRDGLCITFRSRYGRPRTYNEFWVMKEYGVEESWTKIRISYPYFSFSHSGFWRGGYDLLMIDNGFSSSLVMYNFDDKKEWIVPIKHQDKDFRYGSVCVYVESLASVITSSKSSRKRKREIENDVHA